MDKFDTVKATQLFRNVPDEDMKKIVELCMEKKFSKDEVVLEEGSVGSEIYILSNGLVGVDVRLGEDIYRRSAYECTPGDVFGELALFGYKRSARVRVLEDVTLLAIPCAELTKLMRDTPRIGYYAMSNLSAILAERLMMANITMQDMMSKHHQIGRDMQDMMSKPHQIGS